MPQLWERGTPGAECFRSLDGAAVSGRPVSSTVLARCPFPSHGGPGLRGMSTSDCVHGGTLAGTLACPAQLKHAHYAPVAVSEEVLDAPAPANRTRKQLLADPNRRPEEASSGAVYLFPAEKDFRFRQNQTQLARYRADAPDAIQEELRKLPPCHRKPHWGPHRPP